MLWQQWISHQILWLKRCSGYKAFARIVLLYTTKYAVPWEVNTVSTQNDINLSSLNVNTNNQNFPALTICFNLNNVKMEKYPTYM